MSDAVTNPFDGIMDESIYDSRQLLSSYLMENRVINMILKQNQSSAPTDQPIFENWNQLKEAAKKTQNLGFLQGKDEISCGDSKAF